MENLYVTLNDTFLNGVSFVICSPEHSKHLVKRNFHDSLISLTFFKKGNFFSFFGPRPSLEHLLYSRVQRNCKKPSDRLCSVSKGKGTFLDTTIQAQRNSRSTSVVKAFCKFAKLATKRSREDGRGPKQTQKVAFLK